MNQSTREPDDLPLSGLDGSNPLAFLAALGTLRTLTDSWPKRCVKLRWARSSGGHRPFIQCDPWSTADELVETIGTALKIGFMVDESIEKEREASVKKSDQAKKLVKGKRDEIKNRSLGRSERKEAEDKELTPLQSQLDDARRVWLEALRRAVPSPDLALGKDISATRAEFREAVQQIVEEASSSDRVAADLMASFGCDGCFDAKTEKIDTTPFCFITGSGHQYFLDTVRQLVSKVDAARIKRALFEPWAHEDEQLSMRWDPAEDRRYATMWDDPGGGKDKAKTNWAANLLAYRGLSMLPSAPTGRGLATTGFGRIDDDWMFTWPLWSHPLSSDVVRSLLTLDLLTGRSLANRRLSAMGIEACFRSSRIQVGTPPLHKINFTPSMAV